MAGNIPGPPRGISAHQSLPSQDYENFHVRESTESLQVAPATTPSIIPTIKVFATGLFDDNENGTGSMQCQASDCGSTFSESSSGENNETLEREHEFRHMGLHQSLELPPWQSISSRPASIHYECEEDKNIQQELLDKNDVIFSPQRILSTISSGKTARSTNVQYDAGRSRNWTIQQTRPTIWFLTATMLATILIVAAASTRQGALDVYNLLLWLRAGAVTLTIETLALQWLLKRPLLELAMAVVFIFGLTWAMTSVVIKNAGPCALN